MILENISFRYRDRQELAIQDISLKVAAGELLLIAGASGCGKTTLIRCINGLIPRSYKGEKTGRVLISVILLMSLLLLFLGLGSFWVPLNLLG
ncbi:MAG: ATP-binding cassette domain-containing protein [Anaerolineales bacterium]|nr:MAG: ATP-binding cassette domain-containing protein [Anaerolineales bacterium]